MKGYILECFIAILITASIILASIFSFQDFPFIYQGL